MDSVDWTAVTIRYNGVTNGNPRCLLSADSKWSFACSGLDVEVAEGGMVFSPMGTCYIRFLLAWLGFINADQPHLLGT